VSGKSIRLSKGAFIQQQVDPLARRQAAALVLRFNPRLATAQAAFGAFFA
jgi:hypothetical protein